MRTLLRTAAIFGLIGVALGAFGAHGLKEKISPEMLAIWHTGTEYHLVHAVMAALCGALGAFSDSKALRVAGWLFLTGIVFFSGSLYVLAVTGILTLGAVTPLGGLAFMAGWGALAFAAKDLPAGPRAQ